MALLQPGRNTGIAIQTGEAAVAARLANEFERIADELEANGVR
jgi:hypothetical protein